MYLALALLGMIVLLAVFQYYYSAQNYLDPNEPFFSGNFALEIETKPETLTIASYNISYGRNIDGALIELKEFQSQKILDILLLQEMEEAGVERMAGELRMNYVYFPAAIEPKYRRNFGNAVLSRWPILESQKFILPHISLSDRMKRVAVRATIKIRDIHVVAYSIHTEPVFILPKFKEDQCFAVLDDLGSQAGLVVVGGDFNSFTEKYGDKLERRYGQAGFIRASKGCGATFVRFGIQMPTDQIFTKGFRVKAAGRLHKARASDHLPIWATLIPQP